jgi:DNA-binding NarL/FixJ family response regulator
MKPITVLLADDHAIVREGLRKVLELEKNLRVLGEAANGRQAVALAGKLRPDVVLMDVSMPLLNGVEATRQLLAASPATKVVMLSAHGDDLYLAKAAEAGAVGFLLKQASARDVCRTIEEVAGGKNLLPAPLPGPPERFRKKIPQLTPREREVIQLIAEGKANKQTAAELGISIKTVEKHRENLMAKLGLHTTADLTRYAIGAGIIESSIPLTFI